MGFWTIPGGGLEFGEDPVSGCLREVREETGLDVRLDGLLAVDSNCVEVSPTIAAAESKRLLGNTSQTGGAQVHGIRIVYLASIEGGTLTNEREGSTDCAEWIPLDRVDQFPLVDLAQTVLAVWQASVR